MKEFSKSPLPSLRRVLEQFGENLKLARLRRRYAAETVAQLPAWLVQHFTALSEATLAFRFGNYARVMQVLRLEEDLKRLGLDDELGRKLQDAALGRSISPIAGQQCTSHAVLSTVSWQLQDRGQRDLEVQKT